jgi:signal transduction histidine kinase/ActR/RegA family two-component response regulator
MVGSNEIMNRSTATKSKNEARARSDLSSPRRRRVRMLLLWLLGLCAIALWVGRQVHHARAEETERNERYATLLAQDVWNFDAENAARAVRVIADAEQYEMVTVVLADGERFVQFPESADERTKRAGSEETVTKIVRDDEVLGTLRTRGANGHLVYYGLQAVVLLFAGLLVQFGVQMVANKRNLEHLRLNHEITLREEVEARLEVREKELRRAQRLDALGQVAGGVAHDFNNLLAVILGRLELARRQNGEDAQRNIDAAFEAAERAHAMTNRLLAFGRGPEAKPRMLDLNEMVRGMLDMLRHALPPSVVLETSLAEYLPSVCADQGQLEQVVLNLVINSRDAMPDGGTIRIITGLRHEDSSAPKVTLAIEDTGVGMSEEVQSRVFEPFFTTKAKGEGTGLGLSTVARIVEQSQGSLELSSAPNRGTTMTIVFEPRAPEVPRDDRPQNLSESTSAQHGPPRRARVLVVEDDAGVRMFVREALEGFGVEVTSARDPQDALRILRHSPEPVDLVLSDVVMPHMSGPALRERARDSHVDVPFVFMSGQASHDQALSLDRVLEKPFTAADLRKAIEAELGASRSSQRAT